MTVYEVLIPAVKCFRDDKAREACKFTSPETVNVHVSPDLLDLWNKIFTRDVGARIRAEEVLNHVWIKKAPIQCPSVQPPPLALNLAAAGAVTEMPRNASLGSLQYKAPVTPAASSQITRAAPSPRTSNCLPHPAARQTLHGVESVQHRQTLAATYMQKPAAAQEPGKTLPNVPKVPPQVYRTETPARNVNATRHSTAAQVAAPLQGQVTQMPPGRAVQKAPQATVIHQTKAPAAVPAKAAAPSVTNQPTREVMPRRHGTVAGVMPVRQ